MSRQYTKSFKYRYDYFSRYPGYEFFPGVGTTSCVAGETHSVLICSWLMCSWQGNGTQILWGR